MLLAQLPSAARRGALAALIAGGAAADDAIDVQHLSIDVRLDPARQAVEGRATTRLRLKADSDSVTLDAAGLSVKAVSDGEGRSLRFEAAPRELRIRLAERTAAGRELVLAVDYAATPRRGLRFVEPSPARPGLARQAWSSFWPEELRYVVPAHDELADKVTSELRLRLPRGWRAMANGTLVETREEAGAAVWHYRLDQPHSPYLIAFVAGEFEEVPAAASGVPVVYFVYRGRGEDARRSFARVPEILAFMAERSGRPYPWPKLALSVAADFVHGAMENVSPVTLADRHLLDARARDDSSSDEVLAHELAHQWWGDLVTPASWNDIWLSEGLATFFTDLWLEHDQGGDAAAWRWLEHGDAWKGANERGTRHAVAPDGEVEPWLLLDANVYARPALVLAQLRALLGEPAFASALRGFLGRHALGSASTADFERAVSLAARRDLGWFFEQWFKRAETPSLRVDWRWDAGERRVLLSIRQEAVAFQLPVDVRLFGPVQARVERIFVEGAAQTFSISAAEEPLSIALDPLTLALATVDLPKPASALVLDLARGPTAADRGIAARALGGLTSAEAVPALAAALREDRFWGVRAESARALGRRGPDALDALLGARSDADPRVRAAALEALASAAGASAGAALQDVLRREPSDLVRAAALRAIGASRAPGSWEALVEALGQTAASDRIRRAALHGLAALGDAHAIPLLLEQSAPGRDPGVRIEAVDALGRLGRGQGVVVSRLRKLLQDADGGVRSRAAAALAQLRDAGSRQALAAALVAEDHPLQRRDLQRALEALQEQP